MTLAKNPADRLQKIIARENAAKEARVAEETRRVAQQTERQDAEARAQSDWVIVRPQLEKVVAELNDQLKETGIALELKASRVPATANRLEDIEVTLSRDGRVVTAQRLGLKINRDGLIRATIMVNPQPETEQAPFYVQDPHCTEKFREAVLTFLEAATSV
jgi:hypothetical protein